ncbi:hypothetical protein BDY24DRAFT_386729 [Mrakia frigida]|uniref:uncharacterized protein n=1 Tax=Mrakia frigida TaxID=29902 RepID=UPI003FCC23DC
MLVLGQEEEEELVVERLVLASIPELGEEEEELRRRRREEEEVVDGRSPEGEEPRIERWEQPPRRPEELGKVVEGLGKARRMVEEVVAEEVGGKLKERPTCPSVQARASGSPRELGRLVVVAKGSERQVERAKPSSEKPTRLLDGRMEVVQVEGRRREGGRRRRRTRARPWEEEERREPLAMASLLPP